jgi:hypothetical protein
MIKNITVALDFDDLDFEDIINYVEEEGCKVFKKKELENMLLKDDKVQKWGRILRTKDDSFIRDLIYEYLGMGHFNDWSAVCDELKARLGK